MTMLGSKQLSCKINEVLSYVGVNEEIIGYRRNCYLQWECNEKVYSCIARNSSFDVFCFGSQSEGSTTIGIDSDVDMVGITNGMVVVTSASDHVSGREYRLKMEKFTNRGYCSIRHTSKKPGTLLKKSCKPNTTYIMNSFLFDDLFDENSEREGPALYIKTESKEKYNLLCSSFYCTSWPKEVSNTFLLNQAKRLWPSDTLLQDVLQSRCFVVPKGSDCGPDSDIEWRLSFSCGERLLMFDLNTIQIKCYVLMKYVKSTFLDNLPDCEGIISSYMCKTALFHTVSQTPKNDWVAEKLLNNFNKCLSTLQKFIDEENCPHFIMPKNNLLANKLDQSKRINLSLELKRIIKSNGHALFDIKTDNVGELLKDEKVIGKAGDDIQTLNKLFNDLIGHFLVSKLEFMTDLYMKDIESESAHKAYDSSSNMVSIGVGHDNTENIGDRNNKICDAVKISYVRLKQLLLLYILPVTEERILEAINVWQGIYCTSIGSFLASADIKDRNEISDEAFRWFLDGMKCTEVASAHLKLASILFLIGDLEAANILLDGISKKFDERPIVHVCSCVGKTINNVNISRQIFSKNILFEKMIRETVASCVVYSFGEINTCPKELQYEMYRVAFNEKPKGRYLSLSHRYTVSIPQLPYLYFMQYKLYKQLGMSTEYRQALGNLLLIIINHDVCPNHQDTIYNIIGQCMELEGDYGLALQFYLLSLKKEPIYNAAMILSCCNLFKQFKTGKHNS
ncbi:hypothetical protein ACF0H5_018984 [Mactra antiquata]